MRTSFTRFFACLTIVAFLLPTAAAAARPDGIAPEEARAGVWEQYPPMPDPLPNDPFAHREEVYPPVDEREFIPPTPLEIALTGVQGGGFDCSTAAGVSQTECEALVALYVSTNGAGWTNNANWLVSSEVSTWYGVNADAGHVIMLGLTNNRLTGPIPTELGNLTQLRYLDLRGNQLTGTIPSSLGNLSELINFQIHANLLTGPLPSTLGNLAKLQVLWLSYNPLGGTIPSSFSNLTSLTTLRMDDTQLTGSIPTGLGNSTHMIDLGLDNNQLTGGIPAELCGLTNLMFLSLGTNQLSGGIPSCLGNLSQLRGLALAANQLSGSIPTALGNLSQLTFLDLSNNQLTGSIPSTLAGLGSLEYLYLHSNALSGSIPPELGYLTNLRELYLSFNQLTGSIPSKLSYLRNLRHLYLVGNQLTGLIPASLGNLTNLEQLGLSDNQLSGNIPTALGNPTHLAYLLLDSNQLTGQIPLSFINLTELAVFYYSSNALCEPGTPEYLAWKATVSYWGGGSQPCINVAFIEVNQVTQDPIESISLIAGKPTQVSVFVQSLLGTGELVSATLRGYNTTTGQELPSSGIGSLPKATITNTWSPYYLRSAALRDKHAIRFRLPSFWTTSYDSIRLEITVNGTVTSKTISFQNEKYLFVKYVPVVYNGIYPNLNNAAAAGAIAESMFPLHRLFMIKSYESLAWAPPAYCEKRSDTYQKQLCRESDLLRILEKMNANDDISSHFVVGILPSALDPFFRSFAGLAQPSTGVALVDDRYLSSEVLAHELGHLLHQEHVTHTEEDCVSGCTSVTCTPVVRNPDWPYPTASIQDAGYDSRNWFNPTPDLYDDLMSYCSDRWVSPFRYNKLITEVNSLGPTNSSQIQSGPALVVSGIVFSDDTASLDPIWAKESTPLWPNPTPGTSYCVRTLDQNEVLLDEVCFDRSFEDPETLEPTETDTFNLHLPYNPAAVYLTFSKGGTELARQQVSENAPTVQLNSPAGGEVWTEGPQTITWQGADDDPDTLHYSVYYSPDGGLNWNPLALDLTGTSLAIDPASLPGSTDARVKVEVTDGFNRAESVSAGAFSVATKAPAAVITSPGLDQRFVAGAAVQLAGYGSDLEDGDLDGSQLCWSSDRDGDLGCGAAILPILSAGAHVLTLNVEDSDGSLGTATTTITIDACYLLLTSVEPALAGSVLLDTTPNCPADPLLYAAGTLVNADLTLNPGYVFEGWTGGANGTSLPNPIVMNQDLDLWANFWQIEAEIYLPVIVR